MPNRARNKAKADQLAQRPVTRFDTFGTVRQVLDEIDIYIPRLFPRRAAGIKSNLKKLVRFHAEANNWEYVALTVSQGMVRKELDEYASNTSHHHGPIIVDPTARTPDHQTFESVGLVRVNKERMVMVNEATDDVLVILHGLENVGTERKLELLHRSVVAIAAVLSVAATQLGLAADKNAIHMQQLHLAQLQVKNARDKLANRKKTFEKTSKTEDNSKKDTFDKNADDDISQEMFLSLALLAGLHRQLNEDPQLERLLESVMLQIQRIPEKYDDLRVSYQPYETAALRLLNTQSTANVSFLAPDPRQALDNTPNTEQLKEQAKLGPEAPHNNKYHSLHVPRLLPE